MKSKPEKGHTYLLPNDSVIEFVDDVSGKWQSFTGTIIGERQRYYIVQCKEGIFGVCKKRII